MKNLTEATKQTEIKAAYAEVNEAFAAFAEEGGDDYKADARLFHSGMRLAAVQITATWLCDLIFVAARASNPRDPIAAKYLAYLKDIAKRDKADKAAKRVHEAAEAALKAELEFEAALATKPRYRHLLSISTLTAKRRIEAVLAAKREFEAAEAALKAAWDIQAAERAPISVLEAAEHAEAAKREIERIRGARARR